MGVILVPSIAKDTAKQLRVSSSREDTGDIIINDVCYSTKLGLGPGLGSGSQRW